MNDPGDRKPQSQAMPREEPAVEEICREFLQAWQSGQPGAIETHLQRVAPNLQPLLFARLLALELNLLGDGRREERAADYVARFPQYGPMIAAELGVDRDASTDTVTHARESTSRRRASSAQTLAAGTRIGKFEVLAHLGSGTFGDVYHCVDLPLQREVALKLPRPGTLVTAEDEDRFLREARAAAQLTHRQIVPVYEAGQIGEQFYIASKFVPGRTLREAMRDPWSPAEAARVIGQLAAALHSAHLHGIFHRDVKPENVMLDTENQPHLMDFGLARRLEGETLRTAAGLKLGTPAYMSPEQAEGRSHLADARSDQWALGVMLYELLTGERPFQGELPQLLAAIAERDPIPPRQSRPDLSLDLETIALKCLEKPPEQRYPSCQHVAEELERWQRGDAIEARPATWWETLGRQARRHPLVAGALALTVFALAAAVLYWQTRPAYLDLRVIPAHATATLDREPMTLVEGRGVVASAPGPRRLQVQADGFVTVEQQVVLARGSENTAVAQIELLPRFGYLRADSDPAGAAIEVLDARGQRVAAGTTPFHSPRLPADAYTLAFVKPLYREARLAVTVPHGDRVATAPVARLTPTVAGANSYDQLLQAIGWLDRPLPQAWQFAATPLAEVAATISAQVKLPVLLDDDALRQIGVSPQTPVTYRSAPGSLRENLEQLLKPLGLQVDPHRREIGWQIEIIPLDRMKGRLQTVVYPVDGILDAERGDFDKLIDQITTTIEPATWQSVGGAGTIQVVRRPPSLIVNHSFAVHRELQRLLTALRTRSSEPEKVRDAPPLAATGLPLPVVPPIQSLAASTGLPASLSVVRDDEPATAEEKSWIEEVEQCQSRDPSDPHVVQLRSRGLGIWSRQVGSAAAARTARRLASLPWPLDALAEEAFPGASKRANPPENELRFVALWPPGRTESALCLAVSPDQQWAATGDATAVRLWKFPAFEAVRSIPVGDRVASLHFASAARTLTVAPGRWATLLQFELPEGEPRPTAVKGAERPTRFSLSGRSWAQVQTSAAFTGGVAPSIFSVGKLDSPLPRGVFIDVHFAAFDICPDEKHALVVASPQGGGLLIFNIETARAVAGIPGVTQAALSPAGDWLATFALSVASGATPVLARAQPELRIRSLADLRGTTEQLALLPTEQAALLAASPDGRRLACLSSHQKLSVWNIRPQPGGEPNGSVLVGQGRVPLGLDWPRAALEFTLDGRHLLLHTGVGKTLVWRLPPTAR